MNTRNNISLATVLGAALGAAAVQGLHAQAKPKAYVVTETEVLDAAALAAYTPLIQAAIRDAGGRGLAPGGGKTVVFVGEAPKRVGITEWESLEKAQAFRNSAAYENLARELDKAVKTIRAYAIEGAAK
jgi:uncharacterized protein (DUF1330 family)